MAQYTPAGADNVLPFLPRPQRTTTVTTMPTTTTVLEPRPAETPETGALSAPSSPASEVVDGRVGLPIRAKAAVSRRFFAACIAVANRASALVVRYRIELAPTLAVGGVTALGWWQNLAGAGGLATAAYGGLAVLSAVIAGAGVERKNEMLIRGGTGMALAFADVAAAVGAGPGGTSFTAAAIATGAAYAVYVPWLIEHRKNRKEVPAKAPAAVNSAASASVDVQLQMDRGKTQWKAEAVAEAQPGVDADADNDMVDADDDTAGDDAPEPLHPRGPFFDSVIPYADDDSDDVNDPIRIGWDEYGRPVHLTMMYRHTLVAGASDWGKSGIINLIIKKLLKKKHVEIYGIDLKPGAPELGPWEPLLTKLARTPEEARDLLKEFIAEGHRRGAELEELSLQSLSKGGPAVRKWVCGKHGTVKFLVTDELAELIRQDEELRKEEAEIRKIAPDGLPPEPPVAKLYESGLAILRFLGMHFVSATQQPSSSVFGGRTDARGNYVNRLSTRVADPDHAQFVFGKRYQALGLDPARLRRPGEVFLACPEAQQAGVTPRIRVEYVSDEDIAVDVAHLHARRPAREPLGRFAPQGQPVSMSKAPARPSLTYPDGDPVHHDEFPGLYKVFVQLCEDRGHATKQDLVDHGQFSSRDTPRRALEIWAQHGVLSEKVGKVEQFSLPERTTGSN
ncbi:FtsK/SpoIIIE domain-containing protein [Kitasatospora sp. NPDC056731]|uniref:FtsK/SpoIIIE domain-containing protein n=1 Tax=Kitasatospora sp. NPDC056731 TaxID=3155422 RepID=UPI00341BB825